MRQRLSQNSEGRFVLVDLGITHEVTEEVLCIRGTLEACCFPDLFELNFFPCRVEHFNPVRTLGIAYPAAYRDPSLEGIKNVAVY